ncbi:hypothetical protein [uncultured Methylobacterium sp.]|jgi:adenylate kinase family enzyme|uniref:hypothetical protein n=1 Tax=uncultured Methylobacterium sp. TaxID=157278 RepID=UPI00260C22D6|nr:hypothetical protein [uncultured Methylobacterium sp.]
MHQQTFKISFDNAAGAQANQIAEETMATITRSAIGLGVSDHIKMEIGKIRSDTQDFGATIVVILGTPAAIALAKGLHDFISKYGDCVTISTEFGTVVARGTAAANIDVAKTLEALRGSEKI